jgi:HPr kinase/phosphorylase
VRNVEVCTHHYLRTPVSVKDLAVISAEALFEANRGALRWEWIAGHAHPERRFDEEAVQTA